MFISPLILLMHQLEHYPQRVREARTIEERIFLKAQLKNLKHSLLTFYN